ncbi:hypothetical protein [Fodinibius halophilus]|uniref:Uncharacterized protein n=1 Tax=Fodinibius halophilus TaxID=1736908 RepID=A0A6M1SWU0_9BACT|nr:hypothetical protein [Fodinibius halophilus]NGP88026.1 hypothetical protein [Fodinibius halophilus]
MSNIDLDEVKKSAAEVIVNCSLIEKKVKNILSSYIDSSKSFFISEILLNNSFISLAKKFKLLGYVIRKEDIKVNSDFRKWCFILMSKRNMIAHSDRLLEDYAIVDVDVDAGPEGVEYFPVYEDAPPKVSTIENGKFRFEEVEKTCKDFDKYYEKLDKELDKISHQIKRLNSS